MALFQGVLQIDAATVLHEESHLALVVSRLEVDVTRDQVCVSGTCHVFQAFVDLQLS